MATAKTIPTKVKVTDFIDALSSEGQKADSKTLVRLMEKVTGKKANMWGPAIVGFGEYHYKYATGHEGDAPIIAFSPRKDSLSVYLSQQYHAKDEFLAKLGKHKMAKACLSIKKLADVDINILQQMITNSYHSQKDSHTGC
ncbi:MAG: DUF1801 domain-containing protein [Ginsengibacter sp.]